VTADEEGAFAGFTGTSDESATDFAAGGAGAVGASDAVLISASLTEAAGFAAGGAGCALSEPSAAGGAIEALARLFFPAAADAELETLEARAGETLE